MRIFGVCENSRPKRWGKQNKKLQITLTAVQSIHPVIKRVRCGIKHTACTQSHCYRHPGQEAWTQACPCTVTVALESAPKCWFQWPWHTVHTLPRQDDEGLCWTTSTQGTAPQLNHPNTLVSNHVNYNPHPPSSLLFPPRSPVLALSPHSTL